MPWLAAYWIFLFGMLEHDWQVWHQDLADKFFLSLATVTCPDVHAGLSFRPFPLLLGTDNQIRPKDVNSDS